MNEQKLNSEQKMSDARQQVYSQCNVIGSAVYKDKALLKKFMKEHFPYALFKQNKIFTKEMKNDFEAQANRICKFLGLKTIYEYGSVERRCHLSYAEGARPVWVNEKGELKTEPFVTVIKSIYE